MTREEANSITSNSLESYTEREKLYKNSVLELENKIKNRAVQGFYFWDTLLGISDCFPKSLSRQLFENEYLEYIYKDLTSKGFTVYIDKHVDNLIYSLTIEWSDKERSSNKQLSFWDKFLNLFS